MCHIKFQDYGNCLEETQTENRISDLEKSKIDLDSPKKFIKNNKLILRTQQKNEKWEMQCFYWRDW